jgi:CrcB protein
MKILLVFAGGGLGSLFRWAIGLLVQTQGAFNFPLATLISNLISCGILAILLRYTEHSFISAELRLLLFTGFCGGLSTFSTFSMESMELVRNGNYAWAAGNVALSLLVCLGILYWGLRR